MMNLKNKYDVLGYTKYNKGLGLAIKDPLLTIILCNLIEKLNIRGNSCEKHYSDKYIKNEPYYFSYDRTYICESELGIDYDRYNRNLEKLKKRNLIQYWKGRAKHETGYYTIYFHLNIEEINKLFKRCAEILNI